MARHYENDKENPITRDYILCYLLLSNDPVKFLELFDAIYPASAKTIPKAYQEALILIDNIGKTDIKKYQIDKINENRFDNFCELVSKNRKAELEKHFCDTWWWYYYSRQMTK